MNNLGNQLSNNNKNLTSSTQLFMLAEQKLFGMNSDENILADSCYYLHTNTKAQNNNDYHGLSGFTENDRLLIEQASDFHNYTNQFNGRSACNSLDTTQTSYIPFPNAFTREDINHVQNENSFHYKYEEENNKTGPISGFDFDFSNSKILLKILYKN
jgi:hypothetical protein